MWHMWYGLLGTMGFTQRLDLIFEVFSNLNDSIILRFNKGNQSISWKWCSKFSVLKNISDREQYSNDMAKEVSDLYINLSILIFWNFIDILGWSLYGIKILLKKHFLHGLSIWDNWKYEKIRLMGISANLSDKIIYSRLEVSPR